jgi:hypothetical protein
MANTIVAVGPVIEIATMPDFVIAADVMTIEERARRRAQLAEDGYWDDEAAQIMDEERGLTYQENYNKPARAI